MKSLRDEQALHTYEATPDTRMLPLQQAKNTPTTLQTSPCRQGLYHSPFALEPTPASRLLPLRQVKTPQLLWRPHYSGVVHPLHLKQRMLLICSHCDRPKTQSLPCRPHVSCPHFKESIGDPETRANNPQTGEDSGGVLQHKG